MSCYVAYKRRYRLKNSLTSAVALTYFPTLHRILSLPNPPFLVLLKTGRIVVGIWNNRHAKAHNLLESTLPLD